MTAYFIFFILKAGALFTFTVVFLKNYFIGKILFWLYFLEKSTKTAMYFYGRKNKQMYIIRDVLVSDEVLDKKFRCDLQSCKGACCWEGDYGAPLAEEELPVLERIYAAVRPFLTPAGQAVLDQAGAWEYLDDLEEYATPLIDGGPCAYIAYDALGIAQCGIEQAWKEGIVDFQKPVSCHLYPIRARKEPAGFEVLNYEHWSICSAACAAGAKENVPVYQFVKDALIRKYGADFYAELDAAAQAELE